LFVVAVAILEVLVARLERFVGLLRLLEADLEELLLAVQAVNVAL
jgi:hypothetical protein